MKRYLSIVASLLLLASVSCTNEKVVGVDDSVYSRNSELLDSYKQELTGAEHGWIAYVMTNRGYYRFWMDFNENGKVNMLTDNTVLRSSATTPDESYFSVQHKQRATIVFETYCYLSVLNDPDDAVSDGSGHLGLETDFEFEVRSYANGVFDLVGRINRVPAKFVKATEAQKTAALAGEMITEIDETGLITGGINNFRSMEIAGQTIGFLIKPRTTLAFYANDNGTQMMQVFPKLEPVSRNLILEEPVQVMGANVTMFEWDNDEEEYTLKTDVGDFPIEYSDTAPIALDKIFGYEKPFNRMRIFPNGGSSEGNFGFGSGQFPGFLFLGSVEYVDYSFDKSDEGQDLLHLTVYAYLTSNGDRLWGLTYSFNVTFDEEHPETFTVGNDIIYDYDSSHGAQMFYEERILGLLTITSTYVDSVKGKTFTMRWGVNEPPAGYASETIIQFAGNSVKGGILMQ